MGDFSKIIDQKRRAVPTPKDMVTNGESVFGTFDKEFETMDLLSINKATALPKCFNRLKLTLWEATEIHLKEGVLLAVVCDMGIFGKTMNVFWDKKTKKVYCWDTNLKSKDTVIAPNLINGSVAEGETPVSHVKYVNDFQDGKAHLFGNHHGKCLLTEQKDIPVITCMKDSYVDASIEYDFHLTRLSKPCVVSIPFSEKYNRPLYSQKDFFKVDGYLIFNGVRYESDDETTGIIDDHRGYYPRRAHYDWVTTMGKIDFNGEKKWFAFNLTRNQSIDQDKYNENLIWLEGETSLLPPVKFTRNPETKDFKNYAEWFIKDEHGMVDLKFKVLGINPMIMHAGVVNIDYYVTFGELEGYLMGEDGTKYELHNVMGMGEDKTLLL